MAAVAPSVVVARPDRKRLDGYSYSGELGSKIMIQKKEGGGLTTVDDELGECEVVERSNGCVRLLCLGMEGLQRVCKGRVKVKEKDDGGMMGSRGSF